MNEDVFRMANEEDGAGLVALLRAAGTADRTLSPACSVSGACV